MIPPILTNKLAGVRGRERFQLFANGFCRVLAVALIVLLVACLADWIIDRFQETSPGIRVLMLLAQVILAGILLLFLVILPLTRKLPDDTLALWVEERNPQFANRLISAVQLNRPGARQEGMSRELIGVMTREAEQQAERINFGEVIDNRRLLRGLAFLVPALILFALPFFVWPAVFPTLLARQALADVEIPRRIYLETMKPEMVWPKGELVRLEVKATGEGLEDEDEGELIIDWDRSDLESIRVPLKRMRLEDGHVVYGADVPAASDNFSYGAWLGDGRLRTPGTLRYEPRPEVKEEAFVLLPEFCGTTPAGRPYEQATRGDIEGIAGSMVRVSIETQKPVKSASLLLTSFDASLPPMGLGGAMIVKPPQRQPIVLDESKTRGTAIFPLLPNDKDKKNTYAPYLSYTIEVVDEYGFENIPKPTRNLRVIVEPRPEVALLREQFPPDIPVDPRFADLYVHTGMPAQEGDKIRVAYKCFGPYGLGSAFVEYRKVALSESGNDEVKQDDWTRLPLPEETRVNPKTGKEEDLGPWVPEQGVFAKTPHDSSVPFFPLPSANPEREMGRIVGGGRYDLNLKGLITPAGTPFKLSKGEQLEYRVRVLSASGAKDNVSEIRVTTIEDSAGVWNWLTTTWAEQDRIRSLEKNQRGVFEKGK